MQLELSNKTIIEMYQELEKLKNENISLFFRMDIAINLKALQVQYELLRTCMDIKALQGFEEYQKALKDNFMSLANEKGEINKEQFSTLQKAEWEIEKKYPEVKSRINEFEIQKEQLLKETKMIDGLVKLKLSRFPGDASIDILKIFDIIEDDRGEQCIELKATDTE